MPGIIFDTNIVLDYFGAGCSKNDHELAIEIVTELWKREQPFLITATILKDFRYILAARLKQQVKAEKGHVSESDASAISALVHAAVDNLYEVANIAGEGLTDCRMAQSLCKHHNDFEDNLIAAVALRVNAQCIVTRDEAFMHHCPVACLSPQDCLAFLRDDILQ